MSRQPKMGELTTRDELLMALHEIEQRLRKHGDPNPRVALEEVCRDLHGHPEEFRAWVSGYYLGLVHTDPYLLGDTLKSAERIRDGLIG